MTDEMVTFEGLVKRTHHVVLSDYDGFTWNDMGAIGKNWPVKNGYGSDTGYASVAHGHAVGYTNDHNGVTDGMFSSATPFTLKAGDFASAWLAAGENVTFTAFKDGVAVGSETLLLTTDATHISFDKHFKHIDAVEISANSGLPYDSNVVMDNMKIVFDGAIPPADHAAHIAVHDWV